MRLLKALFSHIREVVLVNRTLKQVLLVLTISMAFLTIIPVGTVSYLVASRVAVDETIQHTRDLQSQIRLSLHYFIEQLYNVTDMPQYDAPFIMLVREMLSSGPGTSRSDGVVFRYLHQIYSSNPYIENVTFLMPNGKVFTLGHPLIPPEVDASALRDSDWYERTVDAGGNVVWHGGGITPSIRDDLIMASREIWDTLTTDTLGVLTIALNPDMLHDQYKDVNLIRNNIFLITTADGSVISSSDAALENNNVRDMPAFSPVLETDRDMAFTTWRHERKVFVWDNVDLTSWRIVSIISHEQAMAGARDIALFTILLTLVAIGLYMAFAWVVSSNVTRPLDSLIENMQVVRHGTFERPMVDKSYREINQLADTFNEMTDDIQRLLREVYDSQRQQHETEIKLVQSELRALQAQINPHFIYNTLESINTMAKMHHEDDISSVIISLSKLLRISLSQGREVIPLREELEMVTQYLAIQSTNYPDRFRAELSLDESLQENPVVKFTLQPLVENAIFHGFSEMEEAGTIKLSARRLDNAVVLELEDDGVGMPDVMCEQLNRELESASIDEPSHQGTSFGVSNVNRRLKLHFGPEYGLRFAGNACGGLTVSIALPAQVSAEPPKERV